MNITPELIDYLSELSRLRLPEEEKAAMTAELERILAYIDETIYEPITIAEICQKFSMSRSSLQSLFKENMDMPPKKYINELKLEKSRQMICENRYTISEIALMLGFNSIHYFSRAFTQKYNMAPSEYAKTIYKT